jgi:DNA invertase Pin-like site-specific DNA recombinase
MGALAEFERDLTRERTNAGLAAARVRGHVGGRPRKLKTSGKVALARRLFADQSHSIPEICKALGISRATLYRYVKETEFIYIIIKFPLMEFQNLHPDRRLFLDYECSGPSCVLLSRLAHMEARP